MSTCIPYGGPNQVHAPEVSICPSLPNTGLTPLTTALLFIGISLLITGIITALMARAARKQAEFKQRCYEEDGQFLHEWLVEHDYTQFGFSTHSRPGEVMQTTVTLVKPDGMAETYRVFNNYTTHPYTYLLTQVEKQQQLGRDLR